MNKEQIQGAAKNIAGIVQEETGKLLGNPKQEIKGIQKQVEGKAQRFVGDAKEIIQDTKGAIKCRSSDLI